VLTAAGAIVTIAAATILGWFAWPHPPGSTVVHTGTAHYAIAVTADRPSLGTSDVEIGLTARDSGSAQHPIEAVQIQAVMPLMGYATQSLTADSIAQDGSRFRAHGLPLMVPGPWELLVAITFPGGADYVTLPLWVLG
jgi:hypothetical protein